MHRPERARTVMQIRPFASLFAPAADSFVPDRVLMANDEGWISPQGPRGTSTPRAVSSCSGPVAPAKAPTGSLRVRPCRVASGRHAVASSDRSGEGRPLPNGTLTAGRGGAARFERRRPFPNAASTLLEHERGVKPIAAAVDAAPPRDAVRLDAASARRRRRNLPATKVLVASRRRGMSFRTLRSCRFLRIGGAGEVLAASAA